MKTLLIILKLFPAVIAAVQAVEEAFPVSGQGKKKLDLILDVIRTVYDGGTGLRKEFSWNKLVGIIIPIVNKVVSLFNAFGLFSHGEDKPTTNLGQA